MEKTVRTFYEWTLLDKNGESHNRTRSLREILKMTTTLLIEEKYGGHGMSMADVHSYFDDRVEEVLITETSTPVIVIGGRA